MNPNDEEFLKRILATFRVEAQEHISTISTVLIELEKGPEPERSADLIETVFRATHSLKGASRSVDQRDIESVCQPLESALAALKAGQIALSPPLIELFHQAVDMIAQLANSTDDRAAAVGRRHLAEMARQLEEAARGAAPSDKPAMPDPVSQAISAAEPASVAPAPLPPPASVAPAAPTPPPLSRETAPIPSAQAGQAPSPAAVEGTSSLGGSVRIATAKLDPLLLQAEEMIQFKMAAGQRVTDLRAVGEVLASWKGEQNQRADRQSFRNAPPGPGDQTRLNNLLHQVEALVQTLDQDQRAIRQMVDEHLEAMKKVLMLPVASLVDVFPKLVRDLARDQGKEVELVLNGTDIEIEKRILEELKDPLIHLIRNCIDHGLQKPAEREAQNKPRRGVVSLTFAAKSSHQVEITLSDDGAGIDLEKVRSTAVSKGLITAESAAELDSQKALALVFQSGFSTSPIITDISGRGLGLAIVREKVEQLGGVIDLETSAEKGTTFRLVLPITLATFRGVLVRVSEHLFLLPTVNVQRALRVGPQDIKTVENRPTISLDGELLALIRLDECLGIPTRPNGRRQSLDRSLNQEDAEQTPVIILASADKQVAFLVDEVLDELQVLLKGLGRQLSRVRNIAGAAVLGTGRVVPVLKVADLIAQALRVGPAAPAAEDKATSRQGRILVVEDSITARTLIKNILETAGYRVTTAVDGMDGFTQARSHEFDLVVSDVDMPRMNGFELTTKIRADRKLGDLPVVLVTALESRQDRERGIEVGANAYIVKSSFDQSNLLEVVRKLL